MATVDIVDRGDMTEKLMGMLELDPKQTAIVTIDMHRGHLDPEVATMPASAEDAEKVIKNAEEVLDFARGYGIPIIHVKLVFRKIPRSGKRGDAGEVLEGTSRYRRRKQSAEPRAQEHGG